MSEWVLVPSLVSLRNEFNEVAPNRDRGADGSIGDNKHTSASDHTPDEDSDILRDHDADDKNEVHAVDVDSSGPWPTEPGQTNFEWFDAAVHRVIEGEKVKWLDDNDMCRLNYAIWNRYIYDKDADFVPVEYHGEDAHTNHAHFSNRYETRAENDTRPFGVQENTMSVQDVRDYFESAAKAIIPGSTEVTAANRQDRNTLAAVIRFAWGLGGVDQVGTNLPAAKINSVIDGVSTANNRLAALQVTADEANTKLGQIAVGTGADLSAVAQTTLDVFKAQLNK